MRRIYHLVPPSTWNSLGSAPYRAESLDSEGFIHCSNEDQVARVANRFYGDSVDLLVLGIDTDRLASPVRDEPAFTDEPFRGNPAAVCVLPEQRSPEWMQAVAQEMNLSETAFLQPETDGFQLRWFTPAVEVDLCGHATLASAHVLWEARYLQPEQ